MKKTVLVVSGGLDSTVLAYSYYGKYDLHFLSFDYGQRHSKELEYAKKCATVLEAKHDIIDLTSVTKLFTGSSLTDSTVDVPEGHYADPNMALTVVPNRNAIMLSIAFGVAVAEDAEIVAAGFHAGDHPIYPDCRPEFAKSFNIMESYAVSGYGNPDLILETPFIYKTKTDIVRLGFDMCVPFEDTWSCYKGGDRHCGRCGTCVERIEAFNLALAPDPTEYES